MRFHWCGDKARGGQKKGTLNILNLWLIAVMWSAACIPFTLLHFDNNAESHAIMADKLLQDVVHAKNVTIPSHQTNKQVKWPMFYHAAINPIPTYSEHLAKEAVRPSSWQCSANKDLVHASSNNTIFGFVHVYKAAGTTIRQFFHEYAYTCHGTWISLGKCSGVLPSSIKSQGPWKPCGIEEVADGRTRKKAQYWYPKKPNFSRGRRGWQLLQLLAQTMGA